MSKIGFANNTLVYEKVLFTINGLQNMQFFDVCVFHFYKFQITIVKSLMGKPSIFIMDFEGSYEVHKHL